MKLYPFIFCFFVSFLLACNPVQETQDAQKFIEDYYAAIKADDYERVIGMHDDRFFEKTPRAEWEDILKNIKTKLGALQKTQHTGFRINANVGTNLPGTTMILQYKNQYEKYEADETFTLYKATGTKDYKILGYNINSVGFLK